MALQIWMPLDGDIKNIGLKSVTMSTPVAPSFADDGIIGTQSMQSGKINFDQASMNSIFSNKTITMCYWYKNTGVATSHSIAGFSGNGDLGSSTARAWDFFVYPNKNSFHMSSGSVGGFSYSGVFTDNTWIHVCMRKTTSIWTCFFNGVQYSSGSFSTEANYNQAFGIQAVNDRIQDFRIYDEALSNAQIAEIAKGLSLHWMLDNPAGDGLPNLIRNGRFNFDGRNWANWGSPTTREYVTYKGKKCCHIVSTSSYFQGVSQDLGKTNSPITSSTVYTFSFDACAASSSQNVIGWGFHWNTTTIQSQSWYTQALTTEWKHYSFQITSGSNCDHFNLMIGNGSQQAIENVYFTNLKFELGNNNTPYTDHILDTGWDKLTYYDSSGYCHNGTLSNASGGSLCYPTPRYHTALELHSTQLYCEKGMPNYVNPQYTISFWYKPLSGQTYSTYADIVSLWYTGSDNQGIQRIEINGTAANNSVTYTWYRGFAAGGGAYSINLVPDVWHHICTVADGTKITLYIDNVSKGDVTISTTGLTMKPTGAFRIGDTASMHGQWSDVRIYATALTRDQVTDLYNTSMNIDANGNISARILTS